MVMSDEDGDDNLISKEHPGRHAREDHDKEWKKLRIVDLDFLLSKFPTLAVCYGAQMIAQELGGRVDASNIREYGRANLIITANNSILFDGIDNNSQVWMSHSDTIKELPINSHLLASTIDVKNVAYSINDKTFCLQFHPEVYHTTYGKNILKNLQLTKFLYQSL